jgi:hypothetical protein
MPLLLNLYLETLRTLWELVVNATNRPAVPVAQPLHLPIAEPVNVPTATVYVAPDLADFASSIPWEQKPFYPCHVCGGDMGFDAPSGVCGEACLRKGQGMPPAPVLMPSAARTTAPKPRNRLADYIRRIRKPHERAFAQALADGTPLPSRARCSPGYISDARAEAIRAKVDELKGGEA